MKKIFISLLLLSLVLILSCGKKEESSQPAPETTSSTEAVEKAPEDSTINAKWFDSQRIAATNLYATSTVDNYTDFGSHKTLDGDNSTYWKSRPGAGYGDGIMIQLSEDCIISSIKIKQPDSEEFNKILSFQVFINGIDLGSSESEFNNIDGELRAKYIYIRINFVDSTKSVNKGENRFVFLESSKPVAISEIIIDGESNEGESIPSPLPVKRLIPGTVKASSTLYPLSAYNADFLFDSRASFAWVEGKKSAGEGEELTFSFSEGNRTLKGIIIQPGYHRSVPHLESNAAPDKVEIYNGSELIGTYDLENIKDVESSSDLIGSWQYLEFPEEIETSKLKMKIVSVRDGGRYKDLAISELAFIDSNNNILAIRSKNVSKFINTNVSKTNGTILEKLMNKYFEVIHLPSSVKNSFLLRTNGSFVITSDSEQYGGNQSSFTSVIMDGGWTLVSADSEKAVIKIFGKIIRQSESYVRYEGTSKTERVVLFSDTLTITAESIQGKKTIKTIPLTQELFGITE